MFQLPNSIIQEHIDLMKNMKHLVITLDIVDDNHYRNLQIRNGLAYLEIGSVT